MAQERKDHLIHCITNPISMNQCANAILATGGRPIMAEHPMEVREITATASALLLNLGNITDTRMESMKISLKEANSINIPVVLDAVGIACSALRRSFINELLSLGKVTVIKGNYSEIMALYDEGYKSSGVDADKSITDDLIGEAILHLSERYNATIVATGKTDLIAFKGSVTKAEGGCEQLSSVTGTGCMLGAIIAVHLSFDDDFESVIKACRLFKDCGLKACTDKGGGTFMVNLIDALGGYNEH